MCWLAHEGAVRDGWCGCDGRVCKVCVRRCVCVPAGRRSTRLCGGSKLHCLCVLLRCCVAAARVHSTARQARAAGQASAIHCGSVRLNGPRLPSPALPHSAAHSRTQPHTAIRLSALQFQLGGATAVVGVAQLTVRAEAVTTPHSRLLASAVCARSARSVSVAARRIPALPFEASTCRVRAVELYACSAVAV